MARPSAAVSWALEFDSDFVSDLILLNRYSDFPDCTQAP